MIRDSYAPVLNAYETFWERTNTKRCVLNLSYRKEGYTPFRAPVSLEEKWFDEEYIYRAFTHRTTNGFGYLAEGIPMLFTNLGPGCLSACIGGSYEPAKDSIWFDTKQLIKDWDDPPEIGLDEESEMWKHLVHLQSRFAKDPDLHFSITDLGGILDVVASLRGTENLLYDLYDYPDEVKAFSKRVKELWFEAFDRQVETVRRAGQPFNNWMNIPSEKPWYPVQCDFCYMISPTQFEEFVLGDLREQIGHMDRSIYHLDGVGELPHLDMILDIPELTGIQWVAGGGKAPLWDTQWFDLYKRIQNKKKNLVLKSGISERDMAGAERLIKTIDPTGVYISVRCSSRERAEDMLEKITRWSE